MICISFTWHMFNIFEKIKLNADFYTSFNLLTNILSVCQDIASLVILSLDSISFQWSYIITYSISEYLFDHIRNTFPRYPDSKDPEDYFDYGSQSAWVATILWQYFQKNDES